MQRDQIVVKGAKTHNLKDVALTLPRNSLICLTGVSGSGKSSLAFDTLYAEGQRRYMESLSVHARQFFNQMARPEVDSIEGLSPAIAIGQQTTGWNPRSTVGTITGIYDLLRVLFARVGEPFCPECGTKITSQSQDRIVATIAERVRQGSFAVLAPVVKGQRGHWKDLFEQLRRDGYMRARVDGQILPTDPPPGLERNRRHDIEVVVDRLSTGAGRGRVAEAVELALKLGQGQLILSPLTQSNETDAKKDQILSTLQACANCGIGLPALSPQLFSFNSPQGMCLECDGLGERHDFDLDRLIENPDQTIFAGAIPALKPPLGRWRRHILRGVARHAGFDIRTPWNRLPEKARQILLYGTGSRKVPFEWRGHGGTWRHTEAFEGILAELREKHKTTASGIARRFYEKYMTRQICTACHGARLNRQALAVRVAGRNIVDLCEMSIEAVSGWLGELKLDGAAALVAEDLVKELKARLAFLLDVGLGYLTLARRAPTLSGGEAQRVRLAGQIGGGLVGAMYVLDEPSIGLHARDNLQLLKTLARLRDMGNTVVVVEHDEATIRSADYVVDFGPGAGVRGGRVIAAGSPRDVEKARGSITGQYLSGRLQVPVPPRRRPPRPDHWLRLFGCSHNNLKQVDAAVPLGCFVVVTGVSGSGKSSLVNDTIAQKLLATVKEAEIADIGRHSGAEGLDRIDKVLVIDQSPIGRTPRSNPATYIKVFDLIRDLYAQVPDSKVRGYRPGRFSFNVPAEEGGGRCEHCEGHGATKMEMDFLADMWVTCPVCDGRRFAGETLQIFYKTRTISDVLEMTVEQAHAHFANIPKIEHMLSCLLRVGLGYIRLGQPSNTLSGGEAQRIKLARELVKRSTGSTFYILDEPTTGLHFEDVRKLLEILHGFVDAGNTVLVVEHNMDVIKTADWLIDLGPEGGERGGRIVAEGTPEQVARIEASYTGRALREVLPGLGDGRVSALTHGLRGVRALAGGARANGHIRVIGARQNNLKDVSVDIPRHRMTVCTGVSGSGKSSFALETVYSEGQRRYVESMSTYARQFVGRLAKPRVERIEGLSPAIAIEQKGAARSPRSTVATITEIWDYMRLLWARLGEPYCPRCQVPIQRMTVDEIADDIARRFRDRQVVLLAPVQPKDTQKWADLWDRLRGAGFARVRVDGRLGRLDEIAAPAEGRRHVVEVAIDRIEVKPQRRSRLVDSLEQAIGLSEGTVVAEDDDGRESQRYSITHSCRRCGQAYEPLSPHHFSYNSPLGWCPTCEGLGVQQGTDPDAVIRRPDRGLLDGAILGWGRIGRQSPQGRLLAAVAARIGFDIASPWQDLSREQQAKVLYGLPGEWLDGGAFWPGMRFEWKGLFPAIEEACNISWHYRNRLSDMTQEVPCRDCHGSRLRRDAAAVRLAGQTIGQVSAMSLEDASGFFRRLSLPRHQKAIGGELLREITNRLKFLLDVGLDYLTLDRPGPTLSGGEAQRIRLACQLGSGLTGVLYVLDEPTIGLHPADNRRLLGALRHLRDLGNTLLLVEHDREIIEAADHVVDFGPGAGQTGGRLVGHGAPRRLRGAQSLTAKYLAGREAIEVPTNRRPVDAPPDPDDDGWLIIRGARHNNLKNIDVAFPLGRFTAVTGVSGSGKSSLITETLWPALARRLQNAKIVPGAHDAIDGIQRIDKVISVDQSPIGATPASNAATYTGLYDEIRKLFARLPGSRMRGFTAGRFSFNRPGGRCEDCEGMGSKCVQMHFLPDVWVTCETCGGRRFNAATLEVTFHGKSIADVLEMSVVEAAALFQDIPKLRRILQTLLDVGLDYLPLGQSGTTLSGGEAQRIKLAAELARPQTGRTLYILDEPTTGLHFDDIRKLLGVLHRLVDQGNTVICIEHNLDLIKQADWMIDLGPGPAGKGGEVVVEGTPEVAAACAASLTGRVLRPVLEAGPHRQRPVCDEKADARGPLARVGRPAKATRRTVDDDEDANVDAAGALDVRDKTLPWKRDGRAWHLAGRHEAGGQIRHWDSNALTWLIERIEQLGKGRFEDADWNDMARVEVRSTAAKEPTDWFCHALTGGADLLDVSFRVPAGTFDQAKLVRRLAIPTLDERADVSIRGDWPRVDVKAAPGKWQRVRVQVYDCRDIRTPAFERFLRTAVNAYLQGLAGRQHPPASRQEAGIDRRAWHLAGRAVRAGTKPAWTPAALTGLCGLFIKHIPHVRLDWNHKTCAVVRMPDGDRAGRIVTNRPDAIHVRLRTRPGIFGPSDVEAVGAGGRVETIADGAAEIAFALTHESQLNEQTGEFLRRWAAAMNGQQAEAPRGRRKGRAQRRPAMKQREGIDEEPVDEPAAYAEDD